MNMNRHCGIIKFILLGVVCISLLPVSVHAQKYTEFIPGEVWKDTDGNPINAHGGGLLYHNGTYYWYGEYKKGKTILPDWATWECYRTDVTGVGCYSRQLKTIRIMTCIPPKYWNVRKWFIIRKLANL